MAHIEHILLIYVAIVSTIVLIATIKTQRDLHRMTVDKTQLDTDINANTAAVQTFTTTLTQAATDIQTAFANLIAKINASGTPIDYSSEDAQITASTTALTSAATALSGLDATAKADDPGMQTADTVTTTEPTAAEPATTDMAPTEQAAPAA